MSATWKFRRLVSSAGTDLVLWSLWSLVTLAAIVLPLYLGASFLSVRDCHPSVDITVTPANYIGNIDISDIIPSLAPSEDIIEDYSDYYTDDDTDSTIISDNIDTTVTPPEHTEEVSFLDNFLPTDLKLRLSDNVTVTTSVLPRHLLRSAVNIVTQTLDMYSINDVSDMCSINDISDQPGLMSLGVQLCSDSIAEVLGPESPVLLSSWLGSLKPGTQQGVISSVMGLNITSAIGYLPDLFPEAGDVAKIVLTKGWGFHITGKFKKMIVKYFQNDQQQGVQYHQQPIGCLTLWS